MTNKITPSPWFDRKAEDAAKHYCAIFKKANIGNINRSGATVTQEKTHG